MGVAKGWGFLVGLDPLLKLRVRYIGLLRANPAGCSALLLWEGAPRALRRGHQGMVEQQGPALPLCWTCCKGNKSALFSPLHFSTPPQAPSLPCCAIVSPAGFGSSQSLNVAEGGCREILSAAWLRGMGA